MIILKGTPNKMMTKRGIKAVSIIISLLALTASFFLPPNVRAQEKESERVYFSELMWRGSSVSTADEWIELYNDSNKIIDLTGWTIFDAVGDRVMVKIPSGQIAPQGYFLIANNDQNHQFTNGRSVLNIDPDVVDSSVSLSNSNLQLVLKNTNSEAIDFAGNGVSSFYKNTICSLDENIVYGDKNCHDGELYRSIERISFSDGTLPANWRGARAVLDPSTINLTDVNIATPQNSGRPKILSFVLSSNLFFPGQKNKYQANFEVSDSNGDFEKLELQVKNYQDVIKLLRLHSGDEFSLNFDFCPILTVIVTDAVGLTDIVDINLTCAYLNNKVRINELMPHPQNKDWNNDGNDNSSDEWIELFNDSNLDVPLNGWKLADESGKQFLLNGLEIKAGGYLLLGKQMTKISINDDKDRIRLIDPAGYIVSMVEIPSSKSKIDLAYGYFTSGWRWSQKATPGAENILVENKVEDKQCLSVVASATVSTAAEKEKKEAALPSVTDQIVTIRKTTKNTITTKYSLSVAELNSQGQITPIVLGESFRGDKPALLNRRYLLYLVGFISFFVIVYCYGIYCQE